VVDRASGLIKVVVMRRLLRKRVLITREGVGPSLEGTDCGAETK
jgi:hypothetical protein